MPQVKGIDVTAGVVVVVRGTVKGMLMRRSRGSAMRRGEVAGKRSEAEQAASSVRRKTRRRRSPGRATMRAGV